MAKRRQIREAAIQWLYCVHQHGGTPDPDLERLFWLLVTEEPRAHWAATLARAVLHHARPWPDRHARWRDRLAAARAAIAAHPGATPVADALAALEPAESRTTAALAWLERCPGDPATTSVIEAALDDIFTAAAAARTLRRRFHETLADFPRLAAELGGLDAASRRLDQLTDRLLELRDPARLPERPEFEHLIAAWRRLDGLIEGARQLAANVLARRAEIDRRIADLVENFTPERIDPVDRSILRLAAWEILFDPAVPKAVAINEAIEIAKRFGTTDSARFINGILDRLARQPEPEPAHQPSE